MDKIMKCSTCLYWNKINDESNRGMCSKLSRSSGNDNPDMNITGIESTPICIHDGIGVDYETLDWFGCVHHSDNS